MMSTKIRFLIIDDSRAVHAFVKEAVAPLGYESVSVGNGREGVELLNKDKNFDFVLLDWEMPIMNGPQALVEIVKIVPDIPVSMMTSKSKMSDIVQMMEWGAKEYIMKPFTKDILIEKIESMMKEAS